MLFGSLKYSQFFKLLFSLCKIISVIFPLFVISATNLSFPSPFVESHMVFWLGFLAFTQAAQVRLPVWGHLFWVYKLCRCFSCFFFFFFFCMKHWGWLSWIYQNKIIFSTTLLRELLKKLRFRYRRNYRRNRLKFLSTIHVVRLVKLFYIIISPNVNKYTKQHLAENSTKDLEAFRISFN